MQLLNLTGKKKKFTAEYTVIQTCLKKKEKKEGNVEVLVETQHVFITAKINQKSMKL